MINRKLRGTTFATSTCAFFLALISSACSGGDISTEEDVGSQQAPLYYFGTAAHWSRDANRGGTEKGADVHVCYDTTALSLNDRPAGIQLANNVVTWARGSWGAVADINFFNDGACTANRNGKLVIALNKNGGTNCAFFQGTAQPTVMNLNIAIGTPKVTSIHEVGHALGFYHEFSRNDWVATPGHVGIECNTNSDCTNGDYGPVCTAVIVGGQQKKRCTNAATTGVKLSANADPDSMMAATYTLNNAADQTGKLSALDISGVQSVYGVKPELIWGGWQVFNQTSNLPVGSTSFNGFIHSFAVEASGAIAHNATQDGFPWAAWTHELSGTTNAAINATAFAGFLHLFAKGGGDGRVYHSFAAQGQPFSAWSNEISGTTNVPLASAGLGNFLHLFRVDTNNRLMHCSAAAGQPFGAWEQLDGTTNAAVAAASLGNFIHVFAKGIGDLRVYHRFAQDGQPFGAWEDMGATTNVAPAAATVQKGASGGNDRMILLRVGTNKRIYYRLAQDGSAFGEWLEIPGGMTTSVAVGAARLGANTWVFATGTDGKIRVAPAHL